MVVEAEWIDVISATAKETAAVVVIVHMILNSDVASSHTDPVVVDNDVTIDTDSSPFYIT